MGDSSLNPVFEMLIALPLATARWLALLRVMPLFSLFAARGILEMAAAFALGFPLAINLAGQAGDLGLDLAEFLILVVKEALIGASLGLLFGIPFWALQSAGNIFDNVKGEAQGAMFDPRSSEEVLPTGLFLSLLYVTYLLTTDGFLLLVGLIYETFDIWPVTAALPVVSAASLDPLISILQNIMLIALTVGAPLIFLIFGIDIIVAFMARSAPNMEALTLGFSLKALIGAMVLLAYIAVAHEIFPMISDGYGETVRGLKEAFDGR